MSTIRGQEQGPSVALAEQYVTEASTIVQRQEHLISDLHRRKAAEVLVETFQPAAHAMPRHQQSMEQQLRNLDTAKG
jgi:hypothetical protein